METPKLEESNCVLIVEGYSDLLFYAEVLEHMGLASATPGERIYIKEFKGNKDLATKLETFITPVLLAEKSAIGVIVDADTDPAGKFKGVQQRLEKLTSQRVPSAGAWAEGKPKIGIFVAPGDNRSGEVETLAWNAFAAAPANASAVACVKTYHECMERVGRRPRSSDKALLGALLAIVNDEDPRLGPGCRARAFDLDSHEFHALRKFFEGLRT